MDKRSPAPSLLRPPRRSGRRLLAGLALGVVGLGGGLVLGLSLRQPAAPSAAPSAPAPVQDPAAQSADRLVVDQLANRLATLRAAVATEQARLDDILQARSLAATEVAGLRRELALARREPPAPPPVSQQPSPSTNPSASPPASTSSRPSRAEAVAAGGQPRIFVHLRAGSSAAADTAASLAGTLREAGFDLTELRPVTSTPSQRVVRYFHGEDAATAARLAGRLGRGWAIQDFRSFEPTPAPQTLEIWLPDR